MKSRVSSSTSRRLQRRTSPRDLKKRIVRSLLTLLLGLWRVSAISPETGKLLLQGEYGREQVAVALHALQHLVLLEREQGRVAGAQAVLDLFPGDRRGDG